MGGRHSGPSQADLDNVNQERDEANKARDEAVRALEAANSRARDEAIQARHQAEQRARKAQQDFVRLQAEAEQRVAEARVAERERLHAEQLEKWNAVNREYPLPGFLEGYVAKVLEDADEDAQQQRCINIGVLGNSGTGKSSLLKIIFPKFPMAPALLQPASCCEGDGTQHPTPFRVCHPQKKVHIWDLPGQGTATFPAKTYLRDMGLKYFDVVIVTTDGRWTENDGNLYNAIKFAGIQYIVVRTKVDQPVDDCFNDYEMSQEEALVFVQSKLVEQLPDLPHDRLHLVTTRKKFWTGAGGHAGFGSVDPLCQQVLDMLGVDSDNTSVSGVVCDIGPCDSVSQVGNGMVWVQDRYISGGAEQ